MTAANQAQRVAAAQEQDPSAGQEKGAAAAQEQVLAGPPAGNQKHVGLVSDRGPGWAAEPMWRWTAETAIGVRRNDNHVILCGLHGSPG